MTIRFVGSGGNNSNNGLSWATRKLTLNGAEDTPVVAGDIVYVGAGTYRELLTVDVSGGNVTTGSASATISVTQGSPIVIGNGTTWLSNVAPDYVLQTPVLASGFDGVTTNVTGTSHAFTSAAGNFQAGHIGQTIRISTIGAYVITAVGGATSVTVAKPDNGSFVMTAGTGLTYNVGPEQPYDILSVDGNTQITLKKPWSAPSFTAIQFIIFNPIRYIGDYTGVNTDGVGGVVRVTGSDNDQTGARNSCITASSRNYRVFEGFSFDICNNATHLVSLSNCTYIIVRRCHFGSTFINTNGLSTTTGASQYAVTAEQCYFSTYDRQFNVTHSTVVSNAAHLVQNSIFTLGRQMGVGTDRVGGILARNNTYFALNIGVSIQTAIAVGQAVTVNNSTFQNIGTALAANTTNEIIENNNSFFGVNSVRSLVLTGTNSLLYPPLHDTQWFFQTVHAGAGPYNPTQMVTPFDLSASSRLINVSGTNPTYGDMRGTATQNSQREWGALEYDPTLSTKARQASSIDGGGMVV